MPPRGSFSPRTAPSTVQPNGGEMLADRASLLLPEEGGAESPLRGAQGGPALKGLLSGQDSLLSDFLSEILVLPRAEVSTGCSPRTCPQQWRGTLRLSLVSFSLLLSSPGGALLFSFSPSSAHSLDQRPPTFRTSETTNGPRTRISLWRHTDSHVRPLTPQHVSLPYWSSQPWSNFIFYLILFLLILT